MNYLLFFIGGIGISVIEESIPRDEETSHIVQLPMKGKNLR
jgi:hypothetical protein